MQAVNTKNRQGSNSGQSLVGVLVSLAIAGILVMVTLEIVDTQSKSLRYFTQKTDILELKASLTQSMNSELVCRWQMAATGAKINGQSAETLASQEIPISNLYAGATIATPLLASVGKPVSPGVNVEKIRVIELMNLGVAGMYRGTLEISFQQKNGELALAPVRIGQYIYANAAEPANAQSIIGCRKAASETSCEAKVWSRKRTAKTPQQPAGGFEYVEATPLDIANSAQFSSRTAQILVLPDLRSGEIFSNSTPVASDFPVLPGGGGKGVFGYGKLIPNNCGVAEYGDLYMETSPTVFQCVDGKIVESVFASCDVKPGDA